MLESMSWVIGIAIIGKDWIICTWNVHCVLFCCFDISMSIYSLLSTVSNFNSGYSDVLKELLVLRNIKRHFVCKKVLYYVWEKVVFERFVDIVES